MAESLAKKKAAQPWERECRLSYVFRMFGLASVCGRHTDVVRGWLGWVVGVVGAIVEPAGGGSVAECRALLADVGLRAMEVLRVESSEVPVSGDADWG